MAAHGQVWRLPAVVSLVVFLLSCGGGGGGDGGNGGGFSGVYDVSLIKMEDDCNIMEQAEIRVAHRVTQNGNAITLVSGQITMHGETVRDDLGFGFNVTHHEQFHHACSGVMTTVYRETAQPNTYAVGFAIAATCGGGVQCLAGYGGTATKR